jgi:SnoaL-like protein
MLLIRIHRFSRRSLPLRLAPLISAGLIVLIAGVTPSRAASAQPNDRIEIEQLANCYAHGTDAIGRDDLQKGKEIYAGCFTSDAVISVYFPASNLAGNQDPDVSLVGTEAWADFVNSVFRNNGYIATQHHMGTIDISVRGAAAAMSSYLHATHVVKHDGTIDVANGTYFDTVVKTKDGWRISRRTLRLINFLRLSSPSN